MYFLAEAIVSFLSCLQKIKPLNQLEVEVLKCLQDDSSLRMLRLDGLLLEYIHSDLMMLAKSIILNKSVNI